MDNKKKLIELISVFFENDSNVITTETVIKDLIGWDSLNNIRLMDSVEKMFKVNISYVELMTIRTVKDYLRLIEKSYEKI